MSFPPRYQLPSFKPYRKAPGAPELDDRATTADYRAIASSFHSEFFAEHPDTEIFSHIVKLLLAKIYDERQRRPGEAYEFQVLQPTGREEPAASLFPRTAKLYEKAYQAYIEPGGSDSIDAKVFPPERVKSVVKGLQAIAITRGASLHGDVIGAFFEEILRSGFKQDKGMYFTHANLVWFMLEALDVVGLTLKTWSAATHPNDRMPYVIDPSCGSGTFLLRAMQMMSGAIRDNASTVVLTQDDDRYFKSHFSDQNPNEWAKDFLYGCDPKFVMAITAKVNMVLHGDGSAHVFKWDSLKPLSDGPDRRLQPLPKRGRSVPSSTYPVDLSEQFDVVVSNPPFGITLAPETKKAVPKTFTLPKSSTSEALFIERYAQLLRPKGRLAVVVPESLLNSADNRDTRLLLFRLFWVRAVVSLPRNLFVETPTLTSLLFAQKKTGAEIADWDREWTAADTTVSNALKQAVTDAKAAARKSGSTAATVEAAFTAAVTPFIDLDAFVVKRGVRNVSGEVLGVRLPPTVTAASVAVDHYERLAKTAGMKNVVKNAIFTVVATKISSEWPVYAVEEAGFKLSKRGERIRPNELCRFEDSSGREHANVQRADDPVKPVVDPANPSRVLDFMRRDVTWA